MGKFTLKPITSAIKKTYQSKTAAGSLLRGAKSYFLDNQTPLSAITSVTPFGAAATLARMGVSKGLKTINEVSRKHKGGVSQAIAHTTGLMRMVEKAKENEYRILFRAIAGKIPGGTDFLGINPGLTYPSSNYIGPGNPADSGKPTDSQDALAYEHDMQYSDLIAQGHFPYYQFNEADRIVIEKADLTTDKGWALWMGMRAKQGYAKVLGAMPWNDAKDYQDSTPVHHHPSWELEHGIYQNTTPTQKKGGLNPPLHLEEEEKIQKPTTQQPSPTSNPRK